MTRRRRVAGTDGSHVTKSRDELRKEAIDCAADDMTAIFEVLGKATSMQQVHERAPELTERLPIANLVTKAAGASGIIAVAANLYEKHFVRLEYEATEFDDNDELFSSFPMTSGPPTSMISDLEAEQIIRGGGVGPMIRRRHVEPDIEESIATSPDDVLCLRCGKPVPRHSQCPHAE